MGATRVSRCVPPAPQLDSRERSLGKGKAEITQLVDRLRIQPRDDTVGAGARLYTLALQHNFTRGRRTALARIPPPPSPLKGVSAALEWWPPPSDTVARQDPSGHPRMSQLPVNSRRRWERRL